MPTDVQVNNLIINKLSKAQYDNISQPSDTELYLIPDEIDSVPTANSTNTVTSGGVKLALDAKQDAITSTNKLDYSLIDNTPTIPAEVTESTVSGWGFTKNTGTLTSHAKHKLTIGSATATAASGNTITYVESLTGTSTATDGDLTLTPTLKTKTIPAEVTESTVSGWGFTKNEGTLTSHAAHKLTATNGTATSASGTITYVESLTGTTTATSGDLTVTANRKTVTIPSAVTESTVSGWGFTKNTGTLTGVSFNGTNATVTNGVAAITATVPNITISSSEPTSADGSNGDIWIVI